MTYARMVETKSALPEVLTAKEAAAYLRMASATLYRLAAAGEIPAIRIGRVWSQDDRSVLSACVVSFLFFSSQAVLLPQPGPCRYACVPSIISNNWLEGGSRSPRMS